MPTGPPPNRRHSDVEDGPVEPVEPGLVDLVELEGRGGPTSTVTMPSARTWAKSRTRRSSRLAMRGVPREREAISADALGGELDAEQAGGAVHDQVELGGLVELEVGGEAEPVAQRPGQQAGAGGGADEGERRDLERDGGGARALADDDVDPEVLHRHVEHLLGRPGHAVDLVDEEDVAVVHAREDRGEVAGVGDRRAAGQPQRGAHLGG